MPTFQYQMRDQKGQIVKGQLEAATAREAATKLRENGMYITYLQQVAGGEAKVNKRIASRSVKLRELLLFTKQFSVMIRAGLNLVVCLNLLIQQTENPYFGKVISLIKRDVEGGEPLHVAIAKFPRVFPPIYIYMVEAGEAGGLLETVLDRLTEHFEREFVLRKKIKGAMIYPSIIAFVAVSVVSILMTVVLPSFLQMFTDSGMELPTMTKVLMAISFTMSHYWYVIFGTIGAMIFGYIKYRETPEGRSVIDHFFYKLKIVGPTIQKIVIARFARTLSTLLESGILITAGLEIVERAVSNSVVSQAVAEARLELTRGSGLANPLAETGVFPEMVTQMISVGEETGELSAMLNELANFYEKEAEYAIESLTAMIEPAIIIIMGGVVGFIVVAVAIPMLDISSGATLK